jgi:hypothetical protein
MHTMQVKLPLSSMYWEWHVLVTRICQLQEKILQDQIFTLFQSLDYFPYFEKPKGSI